LILPESSSSIYHAKVKVDFLYT